MLREIVMRPIRALVAVAALVFSVAQVGGQPASAQGAGSPEAMQAANDLFALLYKDMLPRLVDQMTTQAWPPIEQALRAKRPEVDAATLNELRGEFVRIEMEYMSTTLADAPALYARHFTAAELRDLLAFYRTPTGEKSLRVLPDLMSELMAGLMPRVQEVLRQTGQAFGKVLRERGFPN